MHGMNPAGTVILSLSLPLSPSLSLSLSLSLPRNRTRFTRIAEITQSLLRCASMNLINVCRQPKDSSTIVLALKNLFYCMSRCATGCFARSLSPAQTAITKATQSSSNSCGNPLSGCTTQTNQNRQDVLHIFSNQHLPTEHKNLPGYLTTFKADFFSNWISPPDSNLRCQKGILKNTLLIRAWHQMRPTGWHVHFSACAPQTLFLPLCASKCQKILVCRNLFPHVETNNQTKVANLRERWKSRQHRQEGCTEGRVKRSSRSKEGNSKPPIQ